VYHFLIFIIGVGVLNISWENTESLMRNEPLVLMVLEEADDEPFDGQVAVAGVALDRVRDARWPDSIGAVLYQPFQFTAMAGPFRSHPYYRIYRAREAVEAARSGTRPCGKVLWYHTIEVKPWWSTRLSEKCRIGAHIFYGDPD